jgi:hypothetical protein
MRGFLGTLPKQIEYKEIAAPPPSYSSKNAVNFAAPPGYSVDTESLEIHQKALDYQQANPGISYLQAISILGSKLL